LVLPLLDKKDQTGLDDVSFDHYPRSRDWQLKYTLTANDYNRISLLALGAQDSAAADFGLNSNVALIDPGSAGKTSIGTKFNSEGLKWDYEHGANELHTALSNLHGEQLYQRGTAKEFIRASSDDWQFKTRYIHNTHANVFSTGAEQWYQKFTYKIHLRYRPCTTFSADCTTELGPLIDVDDHQIVRTSAVFAEDTVRIAEPWTITLGLRHARNAYLKENHTEPRIASQWQLNQKWNMHAAWGQYHQLPEPAQILPITGNPLLRSPTAEHYLIGLGGDLGRGWSFTSDFYYKKISNLIVDVDDDRQYINAATGTAYGAEFQINKNLTDRWQGWATLSLSRARRHNELNNTSFRFEYDTPVVANLVFNYDLHHGLNAGMRWNYRSGFPYTSIVGNKENPDFPGYYIPVYGKLNDQRAHAYHRLDLHLEYAFGGKKLNGSVFADIINVYGRKNGGSVVYKPVAGTSDYKLEEEESLPLIPSIGIKISF
ncbi:MAG TPA: TonB-dependent receptor, partial [Steroidobacteraceae bacterium]|nr:TonB-dependent receptor [Steroidobacteraceae bacterium]